MRKLKFKRKSEMLDIDITSLLDILVILLVFLLKSYDPATPDMKVVKNLNLPSSITTDMGAKRLTIQVNEKRMIWLNDQKVGEENVSEDQRLIELGSMLNQYKQGVDREVASGSSEESKNSEDEGKVNILFDKNISYEFIEKVMNASAQEGFGRFKFVVVGME